MRNQFREAMWKKTTHPPKKIIKITLPLSYWAMSSSGFIYQCLQGRILENLIVLGWLVWGFLSRFSQEGFGWKTWLMIWWYVGRAAPLFSFESVWNLCCGGQGWSWFPNDKQLKIPSQVSKMPCKYNNNLFILCDLPPLCLECSTCPGFQDLCHCGDMRCGFLSEWKWNVSHNFMITGTIFLWKT